MILEKLRFIDEILAKYNFNETNSALVSVPQIVEVEPTTVVNQQIPVNNSNKKHRVKLKEQVSYQELFYAQ